MGKVQLAAYALRTVRKVEQIRWPRPAYSFVALAVLGVLFTGANLLFTAHYVNSTRASQQRQGEVVEAKLCTTLAGLRSLQPPSGNPHTNPSRAYLQGLHARLAQLGSDLGCR